nr:zinc finger BED domain-containing protein RICESLEEPER 2 [Tanacetum cinerariifolium]
FLERKGNNVSRSIPGDVVVDTHLCLAAGQHLRKKRRTSFSDPAIALPNEFYYRSFQHSEFAFSTSGRVLSIRRTRLTPASLEMCMCLKDHLDAKERKQDKCPLEMPLDFEEDVFDDEVQRNEAIPLSDEDCTRC